MTLSDILLRLLEHLVLTASSLGIAMVFAVPLGLVIARSRHADMYVSLLGMMYTIPSLALFALLVPVLGLGTPTAVAALVFYGIGIVARAVVVGVQNIDPNVRESAQALGLSPMQMMLRVELPLARLSILTGVRTAAIVLVGTAMIAAWIDAGGLGKLIFTGIRQDDPQRIYVGSGLAALLAVAVDRGLRALERRGDVG